MYKSKGETFFVIFLALILVPIIAFSATPQELEQEMIRTRQERDALLEEQKKLQAELDSLNKESQSLGSAVKTLDATRKKLLNDIGLTSNRISSANQNIRSLEAAMGEKEDLISAHEQAIAAALKTISEYDSKSLLASLLAYNRISDVWQDRGQLTSVSGRLDQEIESLKETKNQLNAEKQAKEKTKQELVSLQGQLSGQKKVVEQNKTAKEQLLKETKSKEAEYQKMLEENLARQRQSEEDLYRLESELSIALNKSLFPSARHSVLSWPLDAVFVTQRFGKTGSGLYATDFHNGVDFRASMGTPVKAMLSGVVEGQGNTDSQKGCYSYGRWILIKHDNGLSSIYSHLSASLITAGQRVETGQTIAYSGGTPRTNGAGYSTGPHLHVGLFASQGVEIRQFTTSKGCKSVYVPIASGREAYLDPLAYLPRL